MTTLTKAELEEIQRKLDEYDPFQGDDDPCRSGDVDRLLRHIRAQDEKLRRVAEYTEGMVCCGTCATDINAILNGEKQA